MFEKDLRIGMLLDFYGEILTERQRDTMSAYYNDDLSLNEIAENMGISRQGVRSSIKKGEATLLGMEEKLGLAKRFRDLCASFDELSREIYTINEKLGSDELKAIAERINALSRLT